MERYLGIDTSNYTTSLAIYDAETGAVVSQKQLLPVREGEMGLRQSDAVFHHTRQLPELTERLCGGSPLDGIAGIGVSCRPMERDGSYMPCFLAGEGMARELSAVWRIPLYPLTHQQGHIAAACLGAGCTALLDEPFLAFHVSGGTTDALLIHPRGDGGIRCEAVGGSLDLKAGQLVDRVGAMLGLPFPAGPELDKLAAGSTAEFRIRPSLEGCSCHLSGAENQCRAMAEKGAAPTDTARFCLMHIQAALCGMTDRLREQYGNLPLVFAGGVMSNSLLRADLTARYSAHFAPPSYSADNAMGVAYLAARIAKRRGTHG